MTQSKAPSDELWQQKPKLRRAHRVAFLRDQEELLLLQDPLQLADPFALDPEFAELLDLLDGERTLKQIRQTLLLRSMWDIDRKSLLEFTQQLHDGAWLEGDSFQRKWAQEVEAFEVAPTRRAMEAGRLYPDDPAALDPALGASSLVFDRCTPGSQTCGIVTPYHPLHSCPSLYEHTLRDLPPADELDLIVIIGVDLGPALTPYVITEKHYETPLGHLETDRELVGELSVSMPWLTREGLRHRVAPSLELAGVLAQHCYQGAAPKVLPILCGRTAEIQGEWHDEFMAALEVILSQRRTLLWCSAELSHVGPAYGHNAESTELEALFSSAQAADRHRIEAIEQGQLRRFAERCDPSGDDLSRPSGGAALHSFCQLLPIGYQVSHGEYYSVTSPGELPGRAGLMGLRARR